MVFTKLLPKLFCLHAFSVAIGSAPLLAMACFTQGSGTSNLQAVMPLSQTESIESQPVSLSFASAGKTQEEDKNERLKPPGKSELKKAVAGIRELLKDQYSNNDPEGPLKLLQLLRKTANESTGNPESHYALLSECIYVASVLGAVEEGWAACDEIESSYDVDELPHVDFIKRIKAKLDKKSAGVLYLKAVQLFEQLIDTDRFDEAGDLTRTLGTALKTQVFNAKREIGSLADRANLLARKFKQIQNDFEVLAKNPLDEQANGNIGEFYCLHKKDFERGLPYLANGLASPLQKLAQDELLLKKQEPTPDQQLEIADRWWALADDKKHKDFQKVALKHYRQIVGELEGLVKIKVEQRIQTALQQNAATSEVLSKLLSSDWRVKWESGMVFEKVSLSINTGRLSVVSASGKKHFLDFKETNGYVEAWNERKKKFFRISVKSGKSKLMFEKLDAKGGKSILTGVGQRIAN